MKFYVMDQDNIGSMTDDGEWESFETFELAYDRALDLAYAAPGARFTIAKSERVVFCPVGEPVWESP